ncbi:MAG: hypothetical protein M5R41_19385 [Bacteroidia bacterium]|nr:hypothetical protein [Bacteroidia bacterium]
MRDFAFDDDEHPVSIVDLQIVPYEMPAEFPKKQEIRSYRADLLEQLTGRLNPLRAYILVKFIEKVIAEKDEGMVSMLKDLAKDEFINSFPGVKTHDINGVTVSIKGQTRYEYPPHIAEMEKEVAVMKQKIDNAKKIAEIDGSALKFVNPHGTIAVSF